MKFYLEMAVHPKCTSLCYRELVGKIVIWRDWTLYTIIWLEIQVFVYNYISILPLSNHTSTIVNVCAIILVDSMCMNDSRFIQFIIYVNDKCIVNIEFDRSRANFSDEKEKSVDFVEI